jgi:hypothetical protein
VVEPGTATSCPECSSTDIRTKAKYTRKVKVPHRIENIVVHQHSCRKCQIAFTDGLDGEKLFVVYAVQGDSFTVGEWFWCGKFWGRHYGCSSVVVQGQGIAENYITQHHISGRFIFLESFTEASVMWTWKPSETTSESKTIGRRPLQGNCVACEGGVEASPQGARSSHPN